MVTADLDARIPVTVIAGSGSQQQLQAVVDTGFNGALALPRSMISGLGLTFLASTRAILGDGRDVGVRLFQGAVSWEGRERQIPILECDGGALTGMALLTGFRLAVDVKDGGAVTITALP